MELKGEIAFLDSRDVKSKKTGKSYKAYSLKLKLDSGELSERVDAGFNRPKFSQGDYVTVTTKKVGDYEQLENIETAERPAQQTAAAGQGETAGEQGGVDRQTQIVLQHSQEMAIAEVALLLQHEALPVSAATSKAGQAKRYEEIHAAINKLTVERYFDVVSARLLDTVADAGDVDLQADGPIPEQKTTTVGGDD